MTVHVWAVIIGAGTVFVLYPNFLTFIFAVLVIGTRQHGMAILMHDAAHGALFKTKILNEFVGQWILAAPYGADLSDYRKYHLKHHRHTQTQLDPDLPLSNKFPVSRQSLRRKLMRDITGITFFRVRLATFQLARGKSVDLKGTEAFEKGSPIPNIIANVLIFGILWALGIWWAYFALWVLPLITVFWAVLRLRNIAEHAITTKDDNPLTHARTTKTNWLTRIFLAPYWVNYHVEHHVYMYVPCFNLPKLHKLFHENGYLEKMEFKKGYRDVLRVATLPS